MTGSVGKVEIKVRVVRGKKYVDRLVVKKIADDIFFLYVALKREILDKCEELSVSWGHEYTLDRAKTFIEFWVVKDNIPRKAPVKLFITSPQGTSYDVFSIKGPLTAWFLIVPYKKVLEWSLGCENGNASS